jgi:hypothetical protein
MGPVQLVGAERDHDQQPADGALVADQEGQQVPARPVGPVRVLDHQHHGGVPGQVLQGAEHRLEQPGPRLARVAARVGLAELGQQPGQLPRGPAGQHGRHRIRAHLVHEVAQHRGERGERQPVRAQLEAPPVSTLAPAGADPWTARPNSATSLDLPTPASPPSSTADCPPWRTPAKADSRAAICSSRPTRTGLDARPLISGISMPCGSDIPAGPAGPGRASAGAVTPAQAARRPTGTRRARPDALSCLSCAGAARNEPST